MTPTMKAVSSLQPVLFKNALLPLQFHAMCQIVHVPARSLPVTSRRGSINNPLGLPTPPLHHCTTAPRPLRCLQNRRQLSCARATADARDENSSPAILSFPRRRGRQHRPRRALVVPRRITATELGSAGAARACFYG